MKQRERMKTENYKLRNVYLFLLLLAFGFSANAQQDTLKVLFVGNSFTYFYNLPQVVSAMAKTQGVVIETSQSTVGGSRLDQHWKEEKGTRTRKLIDSTHWDYVVFNNHSLATVNNPDEFFEYSTKFANLVREKGGEPIFMMTWAYKSNPLMQPTITQAYEKLAKETKTDLVPCGLIFEKARFKRPDIDLFFDDKHPSSNGTYLLGLAFYKYFTGKKTKDIPIRLTMKDIHGEKLYLIFMHQEDADFLQQLVDDYTFKTMK
jgi:hypothetical protein